jgi:hypothetical protein
MARRDGIVDLGRERRRRRRESLRASAGPFLSVAVPIAILVAFLVYAFTR